MGLDVPGCRGKVSVVGTTSRSRGGRGEGRCESAKVAAVENLRAAYGVGGDGFLGGGLERGASSDGKLGIATLPHAVHVGRVDIAVAETTFGYNTVDGGGDHDVAVGYRRDGDSGVGLDEEVLVEVLGGQLYIATFEDGDADETELVAFRLAAVCEEAEGGQFADGETEGADEFVSGEFSSGDIRREGVGDGVGCTDSAGEHG